MSDAPAPPPSTERRRARERLWAGLRRAAARAEVRLDRIRWAFIRRFGWLGPLEILAYRGFGVAGRVRLLGRVVEARTLGRARAEDSRWANLRRMIRRFVSREIPGALVRARLGEAAAEARSDEEGYFSVELAAAGAEVGWHTADVELVDGPAPALGPACAEVLIPDPRVEFVIVSDIDDTILQSHVPSRAKNIWVTLVGNALTRLPFEGTTELYRALVAGRSGAAGNPVFYVSKSPWNLYDFLVDFIERHELPRGPLLLRDLGLHVEAPLDHKAHRIGQLLDLYAPLPFVLIGDSGERDPDIYVELAAAHPGRVRAIYIREVASGPRRRRELAALKEEAARLGCEMLLIPHARDALAHARRHGLAAFGPGGPG